ncbi:hypothetical protein KKH3_20520 [Pectobacterium actinidiae]|nr:hypothetical protein KKH3_20520 [Pectobacterium actinidiae]
MNSSWVFAHLVEEECWSSPELMAIFISTKMNDRSFILVRTCSFYKSSFLISLFPREHDRPEKPGLAWRKKAR